MHNVHSGSACGASLAFIAMDGMYAVFAGTKNNHYF
jgi:hypothetical protein